MKRLRLTSLVLALSFSVALAGCVDSPDTETTTAALDTETTDCLGQKYFGGTLPPVTTWNGTLPQGVQARHVWLLSPTDTTETMYEVWLVDPDLATIDWAAKFSRASLGPVLGKILGGAGQADVIRNPPTGPGPRGTEFAIYLLEYARRLREARWNAAVTAGLKP